VRRISGLVLGSLVPGIIFCQATAVRSQEYNPEDFISILNGLGYAVPLNASLDDPIVQQALREFQLQYQLPVDGQMNIPTQQRAAALVRSLQITLNRVLRLNPPLPANQFYRRQTDAAVRQFQRQSGLPVTGIANRETQERLNAAIKPTVPIAPARPPQLGIYTESQIKAILSGFGYRINSDAPLTDALTVRAIRDLQRNYGLSETGSVNRAFEEQLSSVMRNLRNNLRVILRSDFAIAQYYDAATRAAVGQFQSRYGLPVTGTADLEVRNRIDLEARRLLRR
jgi:peptidoglycan hydrolase-like protein with peptidoglycan-binding domain